MRILIAEDDPVSRRLLEANLVKWGYDIVKCTNGTEALETLVSGDGPHLAILDWMMPGMDGVQVCGELRRRADEPYTYVLLLTARSRKEEIVEGMDAGADDYLTKPFDPLELRARVRAGARIVELQEQLITARDKLRAQATHDPLTGLWNHSAILEVLHHELSRSRREDTSLALLMLDIDHFKRVNDSHGHLTGDAVLGEIARRLGETLRDYDTVGRYGGEEFLAVLPDCDGEAGRRAAERIRLAVAGTPVDTAAGPVPVTVSIGVSTAPGRDAVDANVLVHAADVALYRAKNAGRNRTETASPDDLAARALMPAPDTPACGRVVRNDPLSTHLGGNPAPTPVE